MELLEILRQTVPYDPKTPSEPGSAWDGELDPYSKDPTRSPQSPPSGIIDQEALSFERLRQDTKELQRLGINGLFASRREELAAHNAKEFADLTDPLPPPLRKPPAHKALVLEEIRQHANHGSSASASTGSNSADEISAGPSASVEVEYGPDDALFYLQFLRLESPALWEAVLAARAEEEAANVPPLPNHVNPPAPPKPLKPWYSTEGWLTADEILSEVRKQLPPRPPSDSNSELSDDWPWDDSPSTSHRAVSEERNAPSPRRILPRTIGFTREIPKSTSSKVVQEERNKLAPRNTENPDNCKKSLQQLEDSTQERQRPSDKVLRRGLKAQEIHLDAPKPPRSHPPPPAPPLPPMLGGPLHKYAPAGAEVDDDSRAKLNEEIRNFRKKKQGGDELLKPGASEEDLMTGENALTPKLDNPVSQKNSHEGLAPNPQDFGKLVLKLGTDIKHVSTRVDGVAGKSSNLEQGITNLDGRTTILENGVTSLKSRTSGFANEIAELDLRTNALENGFGSLTAEPKDVDTRGSDSRTKALENGITSLNSRTAGFEESISALNSKAASLEAGFLTLDSRTAGLDVPEVKQKVNDLDLIAAAMVKNVEQGVVTTAAMTDRMGRLDGRLGEVEGKIHGLQEFNERTPELKKLLSEGKQIGDHLQNLNDGVHGAKVGIANLNDGFIKAANILQTHAHHISRVDNELVEHKNTEEHRHNDLVERVDGLKKGLTFFGVGAGVISAAGFGLWAWSRASKWLKRSKERKQLEAAVRGNPGDGAAAPQMQQFGNSGLKRRSHAREWNQFEF